MDAAERSPRLPAPMLLTFDLDCGDELFPGHRVVVRGLVDAGRSDDDMTSRDQSARVPCQMVLLAYEVLPGVTRAEEAARPEDSAFTVDATYSADVPLPWSTGGSGPTGSPGPGGVESYDETIWGGESTVGELGPWPVPEGASRLTFWLFPVAAAESAGTVTVDLTAGTAVWSPAWPTLPRLWAVGRGGPRSARRAAVTSAGPRPRD